MQGRGRAWYNGRMKARILPLFASVCMMVSAGALSAGENDPHWTWSGWGGGGWFWCTVFDPVDPDTLYMGGDVIGIYKSTDGGESWSFVNRGLQNYAVYGLAAAKSAPGTLYALTVDGAARTTDGGAHWTPLAKTRRDADHISAMRRTSVQPIAVDPADAGKVWIACGKGRLVRSSDAGETWEKVDLLAGFPELPKTPALSSVLLPEGAPGRVFVTSPACGIFRSEDGGATWTHPEAPETAMHVAGGCARAPDLYYAACGKAGVFVSTDGGASWKATEGTLPPNANARMIAVDPRNPHVAHLIVGSGHFITYDLGATWTPCRRYERDYRNNPTLPEEPLGRRKSGIVAEPGGIALSPADPDRIFIAANWNNVVSRDGGTTWRESARGADISCIHDLRFAGGSVYAVAMDEGLLRSDDNGETWKALTPRRWKAGLSGHQWRVLPQTMPDGGVRIVSTLSAWKDRGEDYPNAVLVSRDNGRTFTMTTAGLPDYRPKVNTMWEEGYARALAADPANPDTLYLGIDGDAEPGRCGGGVFRSVDGGIMWNQLPNQPASRRMFYGLAVDPTDGRRLYWGACGEESGVYLSEDGGESWTKTSVSEWIYNLEVAPSGMVMAGGKNLWISRDHGATWKRATKFRGVTVCGLAVDPEDERRMWVSAVRWGTSSGEGVWESVDGGDTWSDITGDLPNTRPNNLRYNPATRELWAVGPAAFRVAR